MRRLAGVWVVGLLALAAAGCTGDSRADGATATPSVIPPPARASTTAAPAGTTHNPGTPTPAPIDTATSTAGGEPRRTGDPAVDRVIDAVERHDVAELRARTALQSVACVATLEGLGGPPLCEPGEPDGTVVDVFPAAYCEGVLDRFPATVLGQFVSAARGLYAVTNGPDEERSVPYWPIGDTFVVFHTESTVGAHAGRLVLEDGLIVMAWFGCPGTPEEAVSWRGQSLPLIAGPFAQPVSDPGPVVRRTGMPGVDTIIAAMARYDLGTLIERTVPGEAGCVAQVGDAAEIACIEAKGELPGDRVAVLPIAYCEGALTRDVAGAYRALLSHAPRLHSVVEAPAGEPDAPPWRRGDFYLVYALDSGHGGPEAVRLVVDREGHVFVIWYGCDPTVEDLMRHAGEVLPIVLPAGS